MALVSWNSVPCELGYQSSDLISCPYLYAVYIYLELQHNFHRWRLSFCPAPYTSRDSPLCVAAAK